MRYVCSFVLFSAIVWGQSFQGSLRGRIADPNGAVIPDARITLIDEGTAISRATLTNDRGEYTFAAVTPGTYTIGAEAPGFKRSERKGVVVSTQTAVTV